MKMLREEREQEAAKNLENANKGVLHLDIRNLKGGPVKIRAEGVCSEKQSKFVVCANCKDTIVSSLFSLHARLDLGEKTQSFTCSEDEVALDKTKEKQWKQIGKSEKALRLQIRLTKKGDHG